jgi:hypothetical protein
MADTENENTGKQGEEKSNKNSKAKPKKILPTDRATVIRQFDIIRGYAAASGQDRKPVSNEDVAKVVNIHFGTISNCNPFFLDIGLVSKAKNGNVPCEEVFAYAERNNWGPDKAAQKLAPVLRKTWFYQTLSPKLSFRPLPINEAVEFLADESGASPEYESQLIALIDFLKIVGLVSIDGNTVSLVKAASEEGKPLVDPAKNDNHENSASEKTKKHLNAGTPALPPFIQGLLEKLPLGESEWDLAQRAKWLQTAANIFDLMFTANDKGTIDIKFSDASAPKQTGLTGEKT